MPKLKNPVLMATIGAAHGIKGEVRVKTFTGEPLALGDYGRLHASDGRTFAIRDLRPQKDMLVVRFEGVTDRNAAEALNGTELFVDRSVLPDDLEEDEFYHADLIGLAVVDEMGEKIGTIRALHDFGGGDIIEIATSGGRSELIPFTKAAVPAIDVAGGTVTIDTAAAGLRNEEGEDEPSDGGADRPRGPRSAGGNR